MASNPNKTYDCIVIGAGPAGIIACVYLARKQVDFFLISEDIGGQVGKSSVVENCPSYKSVAGVELAKKMQEKLEGYEFERRMERAERLRKDGEYFVATARSGEYWAKSVILATGARPRKLGIPGEKEFEGRGVTYCATCDAPLFKGKQVAVIGGGNTGLETAIQLSALATKVYLLDIKDKLSGDKVLVDKVRGLANVEIIGGAKTLEISGGQVVEKIRMEKNGQARDLAIQGIFVSIGYLPNTEVAEGLADTNERKEWTVDDYQRTNVPGLFAAGDCTDKPYKQIATAAGEGCTAALAAYDYLVKSGS